MPPSSTVSSTVPASEDIIDRFVRGVDRSPEPIQALTAASHQNLSSPSLGRTLSHVSLQVAQAITERKLQAPRGIILPLIRNVIIAASWLEVDRSESLDLLVTIGAAFTGENARWYRQCCVHLAFELYVLTQHVQGPHNNTLGSINKKEVWQLLQLCVRRDLGVESENVVAELNIILREYAPQGAITGSHLVQASILLNTCLEIENLYGIDFLAARTPSLFYAEYKDPLWLEPSEQTPISVIVYDLIAKDMNLVASYLNLLFVAPTPLQKITNLVEYLACKEPNALTRSDPRWNPFLVIGSYGRTKTGSQLLVLMRQCALRQILKGPRYMYLEPIADMEAFHALIPSTMAAGLLEHAVDSTLRCIYLGLQRAGSQENVGTIIDEVHDHSIPHVERLTTCLLEYKKVGSINQGLAEALIASQHARLVEFLRVTCEVPVAHARERLYSYALAMENDMLDILRAICRTDGLATDCFDKAAIDIKTCYRLLLEDGDTQSLVSPYCVVVSNRPHPLACSITFSTLPGLNLAFKERTASVLVGKCISVAPETLIKFKYALQDFSIVIRTNTIVYLLLLVVDKLLWDSKAQPLCLNHIVREFCATYELKGELFERETLFRLIVALCLEIPIYSLSQASLPTSSEDYTQGFVTDLEALGTIISCFSIEEIHGQEVLKRLNTLFLYRNPVFGKVIEAMRSQALPCYGRSDDCFTLDFKEYLRSEETLETTRKVGDANGEDNSLRIRSQVMRLIKERSRTLQELTRLINPNTQLQRVLEGLVEMGQLERLTTGEYAYS
ncbi:hypothetical protein GMRT_12801 [Giardia muris]|uniref:Uncharacterized protein n=1 Tax=Giardia muris TaxID=5742 RepID=A0A4Z1T3I4_GIAMU|nr:hypothetical protein GMRT_12801 [Giardia muris]|eukprot:TNJ27119.1 hypothetical protein GMRT_12801 [Giardia muris]